MEKTEFKTELEELKAGLIALGKDEGEDVLKGAVELVEKAALAALPKFPFGVYILPLIPVLKSVAFKAIDKIDGKEG